MRIYAPSRMQSVKDLPGQTTLKFRQPGQNTSEELLQGDLRSKLEEKERKHYLKTKSANFEGGAPPPGDLPGPSVQAAARCDACAHLRGRQAVSCCGARRRLQRILQPACSGAAAPHPWVPPLPAAVPLQRSARRICGY